ncbi:MAG: hypothetical protein J6X58_08115 [Bacteroidales bacterium]|nr:hypothetical protein [Bacteroidales bacterium]
MRKTVAILLLLFMSLTAAGQHAIDTLQPIRQRMPFRNATDLLFYFGGGRFQAEDLNIYGSATNNGFTDKEEMPYYITILDIGLAKAEYNDKIMQLTYCLGYKYYNIALKQDLGTGMGVNTHWLSLEVNFDMFFNIGLRADFLLFCNTRTSNSWSYESIHKGCFNESSYGIYFGMKFFLPNIIIEPRFGSSFKPMINIDKYHYYNGTKYAKYEIYFELRMSVRLFTTGKILN